VRKLVGKRENPNGERRVEMGLVHLFTSLQGPAPAKIVDRGKCQKCSFPVETSLSEDIDTGKIWLEGHDLCPRCGHQLANPDALFQPLSQEAIQQLFGKY